MSYPQAIILAIIQALTEFLPISSSGHLVIFQKLFGFSQPPVVFDILVHLGTLGAIVFYLRKRLARILDGLAGMEKESWRLIWLVIVGSMPAALIGLFLQRYMGQIFDSLRLVGVSLLITSGWLFSSRRINKKFKKFKCLRDLKWKDAFFIGLLQALAILPGVSRSGSTLVAGLWRKLDQETAFHFSFYLAIPAIIGATVLQIPELVEREFNCLNQAVLAMFVAGVIGYFALIFLRKVLLGRKLWLFGFYCFLLGLSLLFFP